MSTPTPKIVFKRGSASKQTHEALDLNDEAVKHFLEGIQFFPTPREIAEKILFLNHQLGDELIESQLATLESEESDVKMIEVSENEIGENWLQTIIDHVSSILFHEEEPSDETNLSEDELVVLFQKTVSEKIYDRLSLLSLSPHAKKGGTFSLTEELTKGIAEEVGLGLYRREETREELRTEAAATLLNLAVTFQDWLLKEWNGVYPVGWGEVRARVEATTEQDCPTGTIVWLNPDATRHTSTHRQVAAAEAV